jgi:CRP-like cAMP-binding protein
VVFVNLKDMNGLIKYLDNLINLSSAANEHILSISKQKKLEKGDVLINQGHKVDSIYFIEDGCMRSFSRDENGKEHTLCIGIKNSLISDFITIHNNQSSGLTVECVKKAKIIQLNSADFYHALERFPELDVAHRKLLELRVSSLEKRILGQLMLPASVRYEKFLKHYSDIESIVPNYCIASFLGMTKESLSRIRMEKSKLI